MPPSPIGHLPSPEPLNDVDDISSLETQPKTCDCQNQLAHYDWNGVPLENLPELCKRSMPVGIDIDNAPTSQRKDDSDGDTSVTESESDDDTSVTESESNNSTSVIESDPDQEWSNFKDQAVLKDSISNITEDPNVMKNKADAANPTCTKGRKRRLSGDENSSIMICKRNKKTDIRIKFRDMKKRSAVNISVKISIEAKSE